MRILWVKTRMLSSPYRDLLRLLSEPPRFGSRPRFPPAPPRFISQLVAGVVLANSLDSLDRSAGHENTQISKIFENHEES